MSTDAPSAKPAIRAVQPQNLLAALERTLSPDEWGVLHERLNPEVVAGIRSQLMLSWVPLEIHMPMSVKVMEFVGPQKFVDLFERTYAQSLASPMLRGLLGGLRRLSGGTVHTVFKHAPRMYRYVARGSGTVSYRKLEERVVTLAVEGWPTEHSTECWALGTQGCLQALLAAVTPPDSTASSIESTRIDGELGEIEYLLKWS